MTAASELRGELSSRPFFYSPGRAKVLAWICAVVILGLDVLLAADYMKNQFRIRFRRAAVARLVGVLPARQEFTDAVTPYGVHVRESWKEVGTESGVYMSLWETTRADVFPVFDRFFYDVLYGDVNRKIFVIQVWARR